MSRRRFITATLAAVGLDPSLPGVVHHVAALTGVPAAAICGPGRGRAEITAARHESFRRAADLGHSLKDIGRFFHRDHTTILSGVRAATQRIAQ